MKRNKAIKPTVSNPSKPTIAGVPLTMLGGIALTAALLWTQPAAALTAVPISQGQLPSGEIIVIVQLNLDPGDSIGWHYHTGPGWGTIVSGTLSEDEGCGTNLNVYPAGSAFAETPGRVHRVFNFGSDSVVMTWAEIYPGCDSTGGTVFVDEPLCQGKSLRSHLEPIPVCP